MELIDIGVNLTNRSFNRDRSEVIDRARAAGVSVQILTGTSVSASRAARTLAEQHAGLFATAGVHPHDAKSCDDDTLAELRGLAASDRVVAIGETGLDYNRDFSPRPVQDRWFDAQLALAVDLQMPVFLHERDAHPRFAEILSSHRPRLADACVHCFTGEEAALRAYLDLDCHIGITGWICDERRGGHLRDLVALIPEDRLLLETDAPYLLPRTIRPKPKGGRNEPAFLPYVLEAVAEATGRSPAAVAATTTANARRFFRLPGTPSTNE